MYRIKGTSPTYSHILLLIPIFSDWLHLLGRVIESNYKGSTLDSIIELTNGHIIKASEFFDEDDPSFDYKLNEGVKVSWVDGWEWVLPEEDTLASGIDNGINNSPSKLAAQKDIS